MAQISCAIIVPCHPEQAKQNQNAMMTQFYSPNPLWSRQPVKSGAERRWRNHPSASRIRRRSNYPNWAHPKAAKPEPKASHRSSAARLQKKQQRHDGKTWPKHRSHNVLLDYALSSKHTVSMNRMDTARRARVVRCLIEGCSINSTVRMTELRNIPS